MTIKILLSAVFFFMSVYSFTYFRNRLGFLALFLLYLFATILIWFPTYSTEIANMFGIGRGVDFVLIIAIVAILNMLLFLARHLYAVNRQITLLARQIAISQSATQITKNEEI